MDREKIDKTIAAIVKGVGIDAGEVARRKAYLKLEECDLALLKRLHEQQEGASVLVDAFYEHLLSFEETRALLPAAAALNRLKQSLALYFASLTAGDYGCAYVQNRLRIGMVHQQIGLEPKWYLGAYAQYLLGFLPKVWQLSGESAEAFIETYGAVLKIVFLDMGLAIDAYRHADQQTILTVKDQLKNVISSVPLGMLLLSGDLQILSANLAFREMLGDPNAEFRGKSLLEVLPPPDLAEWAMQVLGGNVHQYQTMIDIRTVKNERRLEMITVRGVRYAEGDRARLLLIVEDVTERYRAEEAVRESRDLLQDFLDNANDLIQSVASDGRFLFVNRAWRETLGYDETDLRSLTLIDIIHPEYRAHCKELFEQILKGESVRGVQTVFLAKDGREVTVEGNVNSRIENGKSVVTRAIFRDITKRKRAEEALRQNEAYFRSLIENALDIIAIVNADGTIRYESLSVERVLGYGPEELNGRNAFEWVHPDDLVRTKQIFSEALQIPGATRSAIFRFRHKDGSWRILEASGQNLLHDPAVDGIIINLRDITERKKAEEKLRESEERFRKIFEEGPLGMVMVDRDFRLMKVNETFAQMLGYTQDELTGKAFVDITHPDDISKDVALAEKVFRGEISYYRLEKRYLKKNREILWINLTASVIRDKEGNVLYGLGMVEDISERKHTELALLQSQEQTRLIIDTAYDAFVAIDAEGIVINWNPQAETVFGWPRAEVIGRPLVETIIPMQYREAHRSGLQRFLATGEGSVLNRRIEITALHRDGHEFPIEMTISPLCWRGTYTFNAFIHDITERKQAEETLQKAYKELKEAQAHLLQSEKMASLGQMAAGVAHEINNPVGFVSSNLRTLEEYMADLLQLIGGYESLLGAVERSDPEAVEGEKKRVRALSKQVDVGFLMEDLSRLVQQSLDGMERVRQIVQDLKEFSHVDRAERMRFNINQGIESTLNIVWNELKYKAEVIKELGELPELSCYPQQLNQVFMNLLVNAAQAMPQKGKIWIRSYVTGDQVAVEIEDSGCGIPEENLKKIFDPFFTTKPVGKGTGLGLSVSYGIVQKHKGKIEVESTVGKGTKFRVLLPIAEVQEAQKGESQ
jgi:PAS domain S-box-containing protein